MLSDSQRAVLTARLRRGRTEGAGRIPRRAGDLAAPLSYGQEQLWFLDRFAPGLPVYNIPQALRLSGPLDAAALSRALDALVARHEALRTRLVAGGDGSPVQVIDPPDQVPLELVDLSGHEQHARDTALREFIDAQAVRPFSLALGPLLRAHLVRLADDDHVLMVVVHHAVFDGWSAGIFLRELAALYGQEAVGGPPVLPELPVQFADFAAWERERLGGQALAELEAYWRDVLADLPTVQFPTDRPRPVVDSFDGGLAGCTTSRELLDGLRELARREGTTLFVVLMTALQALIYRYTGQTDLVVGTVSANRGRGELTPLIGFLVNTLPIRADLSGDPSFTELLARVREATVGAYRHQDLPFGKLVEVLGVERDASRAPVFQIALTYAERDAVPVAAAGVDFALTDLIVGIDAAKFDLTLAAEARAEGLWLECSYKTALFDRPTIDRLMEHLQVLLRGAVTDPSQRLSRLPLLTPDELRRELVQWNDTAGEVPAACAHEQFQAQAERTPDAVAAEFESGQLTYAELDRQASQIARLLRGLGVGPEVLVGVCMRTGLRRLAALLGIWKAGGGYVPLDPELPAERMSFMMSDAGMAVVIADDATVHGLPETTATVLSLDAAWDQVSERDDGEVPGTGVTHANVAYVIYTSGSTGRPKGVMVEHRQVVNFVQGIRERWRIGAGDAVLGFASLSFDVSVMDMFVPLLSGARLVLGSPQTLHSPPRLAALIRDAGVTFACLSPAVLGVLRDEQFADLRVLMTAGEELPAELARRWMDRGPRLVNGYGPTETTVLATYAELGASVPLPPPIGLPCRPNYQAYVLDAHLNPVPVGVAGELHVGGAGVARGYLNRPDLTAERFIDDPFRPGGRLYKTGDLVRRRPDGSIVYLGRIDTQVKIRGLRVELGEIETALGAHPAVAQAIVTVVTGPTGDKELAGYLRTRPGRDPDPAELRAHLARMLPGYMIPAHLIAVDAFPLNTSGKVNRAALPAPDQNGAPVGGAYVAPATHTEAVVAGLYATVLGRQQVGATDSFFDLGGSSLQVMRLVDLIVDATGVDVGITAVFLHPTAHQLAAAIDAAASGAPGSAVRGPLAELSKGAGELPLHLIHPVGGTVFAYTQLARELAETFKVYGLEAPGLRPDGVVASSLAELADDYAALIRAAQPDGPYRLAGWSMGGVVAFEVARRLEQAGGEVCLLTLLDAPFAVPGSAPPARAELAAQFVADAVRSLGWDAAAAPDPAGATADEQIAWLADRLASDATDASGIADRLRRRLDVFGAHVQILAGYTPTGPAVRAPALIVSSSRSPNAPARERWPGMLAGPVTTLCVDSDHYEFLRPPQVAEVGTAILKCHADTR